MLQVELEAEHYSEFPDVGIFQIRHSMNEINPEELKYIFDAVTKLDIRPAIEITKR